MCGIIGFTGFKNAIPVLLDGLTALEYRGYDSAGIAFFDDKKKINVIKSKGRLSCLNKKIADIKRNIIYFSLYLYDTKLSHYEY